MARRFVVHLRPSTEGPSVVVGVDEPELAERYRAMLDPMGAGLPSGHDVLVVEEVTRKPKAV